MKNDVNFCPECGAKTSISYSKVRKGRRERKRECTKCSYKVDTIEIPVEQYEIFRHLFLLNMKSPIKTG